ncbi:Aldo/keto reductase [Peniophora sp. CONT]|nr:Aldo/keto reductase [Peniophora sp. CONT]
MSSIEIPTFDLNDGNKIPVIAFGSGTRFYQKPAEEATKMAIDVGFNHIDAAAIYLNEEDVGRAIRAAGRPVYVCTKYDGGDEQEELRKSMTKLGLAQLDLYLHHHPKVSKDGDHAKAWKEFEKMVDSGLVKSVGVSNFEVDELRVILDSNPRIKPSVNQIRLHPYNYAASKPLLDLCAEHGIVVTAFRILLPLTRAPGGPVDAVIARVAERIGGSSAQVLFKWALAKHVVIITTSEREERLKEYLATFKLPDLTDDEIAEIDKAGKEGEHLALAGAPNLAAIEKTAKEAQEKAEKK